MIFYLDMVLHLDLIPRVNLQIRSLRAKKLMEKCREIAKLLLYYLQLCHLDNYPPNHLITQFYIYWKSN